MHLVQAGNKSQSKILFSSDVILDMKFLGLLTGNAHSGQYSHWLIIVVCRICPHCNEKGTTKVTSVLSVVKAGYSAMYRICTGYAQLAQISKRCSTCIHVAAV